MKKIYEKEVHQATRPFQKDKKISFQVRIPSGEWIRIRNPVQEGKNTHKNIKN
jgi:hypothetical protein